MLLCVVCVLQTGWRDSDDTQLAQSAIRGQMPVRKKRILSHLVGGICRVNPWAWFKPGFSSWLESNTGKDSANPLVNKKCKEREKGFSALPVISKNSRKMNLQINELGTALGRGACISLLWMKQKKILSLILACDYPHLSFKSRTLPVTPQTTLFCSSWNRKTLSTPLYFMP